MPSSWQQSLPQQTSQTAPTKLEDQQTPLSAEAKAVARPSWWQQFQDPVLEQLQARAAAESPNLAAIGARIAQARAAVIAQGAAGRPNLDLSGSANRGVISFGSSPILRNQFQLALQPSWELDLFGGIKRSQAAAQARWNARQAELEEARLALDSEVATHYLDLRWCQAQQALSRRDLTLQEQSLGFHQQLTQAGLQAQSPTDQVAVAVAEARQNEVVISTACQQRALILQSLTGTPLAELAPRATSLNDSGALDAALLPPPQRPVPTIPAQVLMQRPDLAAAEDEVAANWADLYASQAARYPRISLTGSIGPLRFETSSVSVNLNSWSFGPSLTLPLWDNGQRAAREQAALASLQASQMALKAKARLAIREVEEALSAIQATTERRQALREVAERVAHLRLNTRQRQLAGMASTLEVLGVERQLIQAQLAWLQAQRDTTAAWIALYRAIGGDESGSQRESSTGTL